MIIFRRLNTAKENTPFSLAFSRATKYQDLLSQRNPPHAPVQISGAHRSRGCTLMCRKAIDMSEAGGDRRTVPTSRLLTKSGFPNNRDAFQIIFHPPKSAGRSATLDTDSSFSPPQACERYRVFSPSFGTSIRLRKMASSKSATALGDETVHARRAPHALPHLISKIYTGRIIPLQYMSRVSHASPSIFT